MSHVIGIDLGGSKIALGLVDSRDEIIARRRIDTKSEAGLGSVIESIAIEIEALRAMLPAGRSVEAVGVGAPGPVDHINGDLLTLVNLPGISNSPFRRALQDRTSLPVALDHDAGLPPRPASGCVFHRRPGRDRTAGCHHPDRTRRRGARRGRR